MLSKHAKETEKTQITFCYQNKDFDNRITIFKTFQQNFNISDTPFSYLIIAIISKNNITLAKLID